MPLPKVLKYPNFRKLYFAGLTSEMGSFISETALMLLVFALSDKNKAFLGMSRAIFLLFLTLGNLLGGALGERFNRRNLLLFTNIIRIPVVTSLFFVENVYFVMACDGLIALFTGIYNPTRQALVNDIVPSKDISRANALFGSTFAILHMIGPFIGAMAYTHFAGIREVISFDLFTYIIGIYLILTLKYTPPAKENEVHQNVLQETIDGLKFIVKRKDLFAITSNTFIAGFCIGFLIPLLLPYFTEVLKLDERAYGIAFSFFGLGGVIGGWLSQYLCERYHHGKLIIWTLCLEPVFMGLWLTVRGFYPNLIIFLLWGIVVFIRMTTQLNYISERVETKYLTRVYAMIDLAFVFPNIASGIIVAAIGNYFSTLEILQAVTVIFVFLVFPRLFFKDMKMLYNSKYEKVKRDESIQDSLS